MKKTIFLLSIISLCSCSKEWNCTLTTNGIDSDGPFTGTTQEAQEWEQTNTTTFTVNGVDYVNTMQCVPK